MKIKLLCVCLFIATAINAQDPAFDNFERSTGLGSNWTNYFGGNDIGIVGNSDLGILNAPTRFGIEAWTASTFSANQFCEAVISSDKIDSMLTQVFVRRRTSDAARYGFHWGNDNTIAEWAIKYDGVPTAQTRIIASLLDPIPPAPGDTLRVEVYNDLITGYPIIKGYHNGILLLTGIDSNAVAIQNGAPGMAFRFRINFPAVYPSKAFEEWRGGSLTTPLGIADNSPTSQNPLTVFPNPTSGVFQIAGSGLQIQKIEVFSMIGESVYRTADPQFCQSIDLSSQPKGIYLLHATSGGGANVKKIIIE